MKQKAVIHPGAQTDHATAVGDTFGVRATPAIRSYYSGHLLVGNIYGGSHLRTLVG